MAGLPKIALARLKANPESSGPALGPDAFQGAGHPDANLLAAFVEKTLTERERTQVLNHLSQCAECREVAAFTLPGEALGAEAPRVAARRRWSPWLVFRWGAMAAVLGALAVVAVLHPGMWKGQQEISKVTQPPAPAGNITSAPRAVTVSPLAPPPPETAQAKAHKEAQAPAGEMATIEKALGPHQDLTRHDRAARVQAKQQVTTMASSRPPATFRTENVPAVKAEREESKEGNALTARVLPAPPPSPAPAAITLAASDAVAKASAESQAGPATLRATTQSVEVAAGSGATAAKAAPQVPAQATLRMRAEAPMGAVRAFRAGSDSEAGPPAALWNVAPDGQVQRSTDGGKTFEQIPVAHGIKFRAIAAFGNDVWAGGAGAVLFHSVDRGATWTRVALNFGGNSVTETITGIQLPDPRHLTVTTASGSQWVSEDGGQHWQKQP